MNAIEDYIGKNKTIMKSLLKFINFFQSNDYFSYFLLLLKYIPLLIITHDWKFLEKHGIYCFLRKLTLTGYISKSSNGYLINVIFLVLVIFNFGVFAFFAIAYKKIKSSAFHEKIWKSIFRNTLLISCILNLFCSQIYYEIISFTLGVNFTPNSNSNNNNVDSYILNSNSINSNNIIQVNDIFKYLSVIFSIAAFCLITSQNYIFSVVLFRPYYVEKTAFTYELNKSNFNLLYYPLLKILIVLEFFLDFKVILIAKIIIRGVFIYGFLEKLYRFHIKMTNSELFISAFCFLSCIFEFLLIKDFFNFIDSSVLRADPIKISLLYDNNILYTKIIIQIIFAFLICIFVKILEKKFIINYFKNISQKSFYSFYMKNLEILWKYKNKVFELDLLKSVCKSIHNHMEKCSNAECACEYYKKEFYKIKNNKRIKNKNENEGEANGISTIKNYDSLTALKKAAAAEGKFEKKRENHLQRNQTVKIKKRKINENGNRTLKDSNINKIADNAGFTKINNQDRDNNLNDNNNTNNTNAFRNNKDINLNKTNFDLHEFVKIILTVIEKSLRKSMKKSKYNDSESYTKLLILDTIYHLYFKKHYARCFFNIEKIQAQSHTKNNFVLKTQIFLLKYQIIQDFINFNKNSSLKVFKQMSVNYYKYIKYKELEESFLRIFSEYKNLITLFYIKNITFEQYYVYLTNLFRSIRNGNDLILFILKNHENHDSNHIRKIDFISSFLHSKNIFIQDFQQKKYLSRQNPENATEKMIIKHTNQKTFIIEYLSSILAEQLGYKTIDMQGNDIHNYMPGQLVEFHYPHIVSHMKNNSLLIKNKEIYFLDSKGYAVNYSVDGSILLTLSGEILVYVEVFPVNLKYEKANVSFISCDEEGELIAFNRLFAENFYIDNNVKNLVQPNLLKNMLMLNKHNLFFDADENKDIKNLKSLSSVNDPNYNEYKKIFTNKINENKSGNNGTTNNNKNGNNLNPNSNSIVIKFSYIKLIKNIRALDYSKLWDYNNEIYFRFLERLNFNRYAKMDRIMLTIEITKRNLQEKFFFFDFRFHIEEQKEDAEMLKMHMGSNIPSLLNAIKFSNLKNIKSDNTANEDNKIKNQNSIGNTDSKIMEGNNSTNVQFTGTFTHMKMEPQRSNSLNPKQHNEKIVSAKSKIMSVIKKIASVGFLLKNMGWDSNTGTFAGVDLESEEKKIKRDYSKLDYQAPKKLRLENSFLRMFIFIAFILAIFIFLSFYKKEIFEQMQIFYDIKLKINFLQQVNYYAINSIFAINLSFTKLLPQAISFKNLNYSAELNNSVEFHKANLLKRGELYQENLYAFGNSFLSSNEYLMENLKNIFSKTQKFFVLENDWEILINEITLSDFLEMHYRQIHKIYASEDMNLLFYNEKSQFGYKLGNQFYTAALDFYSYPSFYDKSVFFYFQNSITLIKNSFDVLKTSLDSFSDELDSHYRTRLLIFFISISLLVVLFFILEGILFYHNYEKVFMKYFILFNILKFYHKELYIKVELLDELFLDFTDLNRIKYGKLADNEELYKKKIFENFSEQNSKFSKSNGNNFNVNDPNFHGYKGNKFKSLRLFDYYEELKAKADATKKSKFNTKIQVLESKDSHQKDSNAISNFNKKKFSFKNITTENNEEENFNNKLAIKVNNSQYLSLGFSNKNLLKKKKSEMSFANMQKGGGAYETTNTKTNSYYYNNVDLTTNNNLDFDTNANLKPQDLAQENIVENLNRVSSIKLHKAKVNEKIDSSKYAKNDDQGKSQWQKSNKNSKTKQRSSKSINSIDKNNITSKSNHTRNNNKSILGQTETNIFIKNQNHGKENLKVKSSAEKETKMEKENMENNEDQNKFLKKPKSYYAGTILFWGFFLIILILIILNFVNSLSRFTSLKKCANNSQLFFNRISLFSEALMIYEFSVFRSDSNFLIFEKDKFIEKIYDEFKTNELNVINMINTNDPMLEDLISFEARINLKDSFCKFLAVEINKKNNLISEESYLNSCQQISQNIFSVGFAKAIKNMFNYIMSLNTDLINLFKANGALKSSDIERHLNDFYYVFSFANNDRIIYDLNIILHDYVKAYRITAYSDLENFNDFLFYFLYMFIILLGFFSIYKSKFLIKDSDKVITYMTSIVENGVKFTKS